MSAVASMAQESVFDGSVIATDGSLLVRNVTITGRRAKRGDGDGQVWRGLFALPRECDYSPTFGDSVCLRLDDETQVAAVITEVAGRLVHIRARGQMPHCR